jgi:hypothetical protein
MPMMRFGLTEDAIVRRHSDNAVKLLWTGAGALTIAAVPGLVQEGRALIIPIGTTLLLMGTTAELDGQLRAVSAGGVDAFRVKAQGGDNPVISSVAARKWTAEGGGVGVPHQVTIIGLSGGAMRFGGPWQGILGQYLASPRVTINDLLAELPVIKANF